MTEYSDGDYLYGADVDNLIESSSNNGILTGLGVTENTPTPDMNIIVAAGSGFAGETSFVKGSGTVVPITAVHASLDRLDIIVVNSSGTISAVAGTPATAPNPPDLPDNSIMLAIVEVDATVTQIFNADIIDRSLLVGSIQAEHIGDGEIANAKIDSAAAIAMSKLNLAITNSEVAGGAAIAWAKIVKGNHADLLNLLAHDHTQYPRKATAETISAIYEHTADLRMKNGKELEVWSSSTERGEIYGSSIGVILNVKQFGQNFTLQYQGTTMFEFGGLYHTAHDDIRPDVCGSRDLGTSGQRWEYVWTENALEVSSCDVAEYFVGDGLYSEHGDVMVLEKESGLLVKCTRANASQVIGVISERPALVMGNEAHKAPTSKDKEYKDLSDELERTKTEFKNQRGKKGKTKSESIRDGKRFHQLQEEHYKVENERVAEKKEQWDEINVLIGLVGSVPVKVTGIVEIGDYLITSEQEGVARSILPEDKIPLFVIGRAMGFKKDAGIKKVKMIIENKILYHQPLEVN